MVRRSSPIAVFSCLSKSNPVTVSLDIHDESTWLFCVDLQTGELLADTRVQGHYSKVLPHLKRLERRGKIVVLYEAGPHGFAPYRLFEKHGYHTKVIAPVSIPKRNRRDKTDRNDATSNLNLYAGGFLSFVSVPDASIEYARDCLRYRTQTVWGITRVKQRLISLVKKLGLQYTQTKSNWTKAHFAWFRSVEVAPCTRVVIDSYLESITTFEQQCATAETALRDFIDTHPVIKRQIDAYRTIRGIGEVYAMTLAFEGGDLTRFRHPNQVMAWAGLIPGKHQSGSSDPALRITRAGNKYFRTALVGVARVYRDHRMLYSAAEIKKMDPSRQEFFTKTQNRLTHTYRKLKAAGKHTNKARVAVARELCGFLWEFSRDIITKTALPTAAKAA